MNKIPPVRDSRLRAKMSDSSPAPDVLTYSIGDLAREFGVSLRTLRFYEDRGLISPWRDGITRVYSARDKARLSLILKGKQLGFTLTEIRAMLAEHEGGDSTPSLPLSIEQIDEQIAHLEGQLAEVEAALKELRQVRRTRLAKAGPRAVSE
jgi:DNA-binding transcriptional MerR regulator